MHLQRPSLDLLPCVHPVKLRIYTLVSREMEPSVVRYWKEKGGKGEGGKEKGEIEGLM